MVSVRQHVGIDINMMSDTMSAAVDMLVSDKQSLRTEF